MFIWIGIVNHFAIRSMLQYIKYLRSLQMGYCRRSMCHRSVECMSVASLCLQLTINRLWILFDFDFYCCAWLPFSFCHRLVFLFHCTVHSIQIHNFYLNLSDFFFCSFCWDCFFLLWLKLYCNCVDFSWIKGIFTAFRFRSLNSFVHK